jgi:hypothetical protein
MRVQVTLQHDGLFGHGKALGEAPRVSGEGHFPDRPPLAGDYTEEVILAVVGDHDERLPHLDAGVPREDAAVAEVHRDRSSDRLRPHAGRQFGQINRCGGKSLDLGLRNVVFALRWDVHKNSSHASDVGQRVFIVVG